MTPVFPRSEVSRNPSTVHVSRPGSFTESVLDAQRSGGAVGDRLPHQGSVAVGGDSEHED
jgi:hypothetical protein